MEDLYFLPFALYVVVVMILTAFSLLIYLCDREEFSVPNIKYIYNNTKLNIFGCILVATITFIFNPICSILWILYHFIYFITHVGRKR